jgi:hypothetical protein
VFQAAPQRRQSFTAYGRHDLRIGLIGTRIR